MTERMSEDVAVVREALGYGWGYGDEALTEVELARREVICIASDALDRLQARLEAAEARVSELETVVSVLTDGGRVAHPRAQMLEAQAERDEARADAERLAGLWQAYFDDVPVEHAEVKAALAAHEEQSS